MNQSAQAILSIDKIDLKHFGHRLKFLINNSSKIGLYKVQAFNFKKLSLSIFVEQFLFQSTTHLETLLAHSALTLINNYAKLKSISPFWIFNTCLSRLHKTKQSILLEPIRNI